MKLDSYGVTETNCKLENQTFKIQASPIAFEILSSKLYANPVLAVVRELLTNAYDSHKLANNLETPISVHFPDYTDTSFRIRDYGTGLSKEDVLEMYTTFFSSTKSDTNDFTGCFGLGSKTPFSYSSMFTVNSYFNGMKYCFAAVKQSGYPHIYSVSEEPTDEPNGLEVSIPTECDNSFFQNADSYLRFMPEIVITSNKAINQLKPLHVMGNILLYKGKQESYGYINKMYIKQGQNIYTVEAFTMFSSTKFISKLLKKQTIVIEVPIGTLDITPSRESLSQEENNRLKVIDIIDGVEEQIKQLVTSDDELLKELDGSLYDQVLSDRYLKGLNCSLHNNPYGAFKTYFTFNQCKHWHINRKSRMSMSSVYENHEVLVVASKEPDIKTINKLKNICANYDIETISLLILPTNRSLLETVREVKQVVEIITNIPECPGIDMEFFTINKFLKEYPDHKKYGNDGPKNIWSEASSVLLNGKTKGLRRETRSVEELKQVYLPSNTFVVSGDNRSFITDAIGLLKIFLSKVQDVEGKNFILDYINSLGLNLQDQLNFLIVAKSNMRLFRKYKRISSLDLHEVIKKTIWFVKSSDNISERQSTEFLTKLRTALDFNFKGKTRDYIQQHKIYKLINKLIEYYTGRVISHVNLLHTVEIDYLKLKGLLPIYKLKSDSWLDKLPQDIQQLEKILDIRWESRLFYVPPILREKYEKDTYIPPSRKKWWSSHQLTINKLSEYQKHLILKLLRGEQNVLR